MFLWKRYFDKAANIMFTIDNCASSSPWWCPLYEVSKDDGCDARLVGEETIYVVDLSIIKY